MKTKGLMVGIFALMILIAISEAQEVPSSHSFFTLFGQVTDGGVGVNGAVVSLTANGVTMTTVTVRNNRGEDGFYLFELANFPDVTDSTQMTLSVTAGKKSSSTTITRGGTVLRRVDMAAQSPVLTAITIMPTVMAVSEGTTSTLKASSLDQFRNPVAATVTWSSGNTTVITINSSTGVFTALSAGNATITAASGTVSGTATVTVLGSAGIKVVPPKTAIVVGGSTTFTAQTLDQNGDPFPAAVSWSITGAGTIDPNTGVFNATAAGTTTVTASSGKFSATATVTAVNTGQDVCRDSKRTIHYDVAAIDVVIPVNGWGDFNPQGMMYALDSDLAVPNVAQIRDPDFKLYNTTDATLPGKIMPLTLRANVGDCIEVTLTNRLDTIFDTINPGSLEPIDATPAKRNVGMQIMGLPYDPVISDSGFAGNNPDTTAAPGQNKTYRWFASRTGGFLFRDQTNAQFPEDTMNKGLFGMVIVEQPDSTWFDSVTGRNFLKAKVQQGLGVNDHNLSDLIPEKEPDRFTGKPVFLGIGANIFASVHQVPCESKDVCSHPLPKGALLWENVSGNDYRTYALMMSDEMEGLVGPIAWNEDGSIAAFGQPFFPPTGLEDSTKTMNYRSEPLRNRESAWFRHRGVIPMPEVDDAKGMMAQGGLVDGLEPSPFRNTSACPTCVDILLPILARGAPHGNVRNRVLTVNASNMTVILPNGRKFLPQDDFCNGGQFKSDNAPEGINYTFYPCQGEESHLQSWPFGDPAAALPRAYWGDPVIYYAATAGTKETHTFHQHTHRWFHDPEQANLSLLPLPENNIQESNRLDVQGISPGEVFKIVLEQGAGSQAGTAGDAIFHCHLYPHFAEGLWSAFRVFDKLRINFTDPANINSTLQDGTPLFYPDGTQEAALVPLPAKMALFDTRVPGADDRRVPAPRGMPNRTAMPPDAAHPGYPNFIAGKFGEKALQPPMFIIDRNTSQPIKDRATPTRLELNATYDGIRPGVVLVDPCAGPNHEFGEPGRKPDRIYEPFTIQVPLLQNAKGGFFTPEQRAYVEKEDVPLVRADPSRLKPYAWRNNVGDCVEWHATNDVQPGGSTPTLGVNDGIFHVITNTPEISNHPHILRFDQIGTDGTSVNWNYDISARSQETVGYRLFVDINGRTVFNHDHQFPTSHQQGSVYAAIIIDPMNSSYFKPNGEPLGPFTSSDITYNLTSKKYTREQAKGVGVEANIIVDPVRNDVNGGIMGGRVAGFREFVVFYGDFGPSFVADPAKLKEAFDEINSGSLVADPFRQDLKVFNVSLRTRPFNPPPDLDDYGSDQGISPMNYRIEPFQARVNVSSLNATMREPAFVFSSAVFGDPESQVFRAYPGDPVVFKTVDGAHEDHHGFELHGHRWLHQPSDPGSFLTDSQYMNIGEWFNYELQGNLNNNPPGNDITNGNQLSAGLAGDYLFGSMPLQEIWQGAWGIFRVENGKKPGLAVLPGRPEPKEDPNLGLLAPGQALEGVGEFTARNTPCPKDAPVKEFNIVAIAKPTVYNAMYGDNDPFTMFYALEKDEQLYLSGTKQPEPLVIRANAGDCVRVNLKNHLPDLTALAEKTPVNFLDLIPENITGVRIKTPVLVNSNTSLDPETLQHLGDSQPDAIALAQVPTIMNGTPTVPLGMLPIGGSQIGMKKTDITFVKVKWPISNRVSLHQHLLKEVASVGDGATVGYMRDQTIAPGENITYNWYADRELGGVLLDDFGDMRSHRHHGLFAALIIEPKGSKYLNPRDMKELASGTSAVIDTDGRQMREFVPLFMDSLNLRNGTNFLLYDTAGTVLELDHQPCSPRNIRCEDVEDEGEFGINYRTERLENRVPLAFGFGHGGGTATEELFTPDTFKAFSSQVFQDPETPVFPAFAGDPTVMRPMNPEDARRVLNIGLAGHSWRHEPDDPNTNIVDTEGSFGVGKSFNFYLIGGAGGERNEPGDYIYNDRLNAPEIKHLSGGMWGLLRVFPQGAAADILPLGTKAEQPVQAGGGGGVGFGGSGVVTDEPLSNIEKAETHLDDLRANATVAFSFDPEHGGVYGINITGMENENDVAVRVEHLAGLSPKLKEPAPGIVYRYVNIWAGTERIKEALLSFGVENAWMSSNNIADGEIKMLRWDGGKWVQLETALKSKDATYTHFEARTSAFSRFAISGIGEKAAPAEAEPISAPTELPAATPTGTAKATAGFEAAAAIAALVLLYARMRKRKNPML